MFAGVVHPAPSEKLTASLAPGYGLTRTQLERTIPLLLQRPITVEHHGVFEAVRQVGAAVPLPADVKKAMIKLAKTDASSAIVGSVIDAFIGPKTGALYIIYGIDELLMPSIEFLILNRFLPGLSMTHVVSQVPTEKDQPDPQVVPYEVTLCSEPARPGCYTFLTGSSVELQRYKRSIEKGAIAEPEFSAPPLVMSAEEAQPPQRSEIEQAFDSIDNEETRKVIAARLTAMVKSLDATKAEKEALEQKYSGLVKASSVNERMLKNQLSLFQKQLGEQMCSDYCLNDDQTHSAIDGARDDPAALMQVLRTPSLPSTICWRKWPYSGSPPVLPV